MDNLEEKKF